MIDKYVCNKKMLICHIRCFSYWVISKCNSFSKQINFIEINDQIIIHETYRIIVNGA